MRFAFVSGVALLWAASAFADAVPKGPDVSHRGLNGLHILALWPQPVADEATIIVQSAFPAEGTFELLTLQGHRVARSPIQFFDGETQGYRWAPGKLRPGVYLLRLTGSDRSSVSWKWVQH